MQHGYSFFCHKLISILFLFGNEATQPNNFDITSNETKQNFKSNFWHRNMGTIPYIFHTRLSFSNFTINHFGKLSAVRTLYNLFFCKNLINLYYSDAKVFVPWPWSSRRRSFEWPILKNALKCYRTAIN